MPPGYRLVTFDRVASTNTEAMRLAAAGDPGNVWLVADEQTSGRGRSGRNWSDVPGNLTASLLLRLSCGPEIAQQLALLTGVAVVDAVRRLACVGSPPPLSGRIGEEGVHDDTCSAPPPPHSSPVQGEGGVPTLRLKWPNDVLIGQAKFGGILLESAQGLGGPGLVAVIGIGLNIAGTPEGLDRAATSLAASGIATNRDAVLGFVASAMDAALAIWDEGEEFQTIREAWADRAGPVGEPLIVNAGQGPVSGRFAGLDRDGALLLADGQGGTRRFTYGDVTLAGSAGAQ